jgi:hypothetical protein
MHSTRPHTLNRSSIGLENNLRSYSRKLLSLPLAHDGSCPGVALNIIGQLHDAGSLSVGKESLVLIERGYMFVSRKSNLDFVEMRKGCFGNQTPV